MNKKQTKHDHISFVMCISNKDCEDLEIRKIYVAIPDSVGEEEGYLRVVDESGEDYLYPQANFISVTLPREAQNVFDTAR